MMYLHTSQSATFPFIRIQQPALSIYRSPKVAHSVEKSVKTSTEKNGCESKQSDSFTEVQIHYLGKQFLSNIHKQGIVSNPMFRV